MCAQFEMEEEELGMRLIECRHNCAYNYPAMVLFASDLKKDVADNLIDVLRSLASDSYFYVGRKIAAGFYEVRINLKQFDRTRLYINLNI